MSTAPNYHVITAAQGTFRKKMAQRRRISGETRVTVVGSREKQNADVIHSRVVHEVTKHVHNTDLFNTKTFAFLCGGARGADRIGQSVAEELGHTIIEYPADWKQYPKVAGLRRNIQMAAHTDVLIAFWDQKSTGTHHMLKACRAFNKHCPKHEIEIILYDLKGRKRYHYCQGHTGGKL